MSENEDKPKKKTRREFLQDLGYMGVGALIGGSAIFAGVNYDKRKKQVDRIKVLTAENELIEIEKNSGIPVVKSKKEILTYLQKEGREGIAGKRWVMVLDLPVCTPLTSRTIAYYDPENAGVEEYSSLLHAKTMPALR